jgi:hypothetical protein
MSRRNFYIAIMVMMMIALAILALILLTIWLFAAVADIIDHDPVVRTAAIWTGLSVWLGGTAIMIMFAWDTWRKKHGKD